MINVLCSSPLRMMSRLCCVLSTTYRSFSHSTLPLVSHAPIVSVIPNPLFTIALIGRPNVGKSTLFNRLVGGAHAIVHDTPGVTRDWQAEQGRLGEMRFRVIDSPGAEDREELRTQIMQALGESHVALFVVDTRAGIQPLDLMIARWLRTSRIQSILVCNKCDTGREYALLDPVQLQKLDLGEGVALSAEHGGGLSELADALFPWYDQHVNDLQQQGIDVEPEKESELLRLSIVGRPNAGKSTLVNALLGFDRVRTGDMPGLTRDSIQIFVRYKQQTLLLVDTAGLRRRIITLRRDDILDQKSREDSWRHLYYSNVAILVTEATEVLTREEITIARRVVEEGRALVLAISKIDLLKEDDQKTIIEFVRKRAEQALPQVVGLEIVPISAVTGSGLRKLMDTCLRVFQRWTRRIPTSRLNRFVNEYLRTVEVSGLPKIHYLSQVSGRPPTFVVFHGGGSSESAFSDSAQRFLVNAIRKEFHLEGVPIRVYPRTRRSEHSRKSNNTPLSKKKRPRHYTV